MRIRDRLRSIRIRPPGRVKGERITPVSPDPVLSYQRDGHVWSFEDGHVKVDGYDVNPVISEEETTVSTLIGLASGLDDYKKNVETYSQKPATAGKLVSMCDALIEKVLGKVKKVYDDKIYGVSWKLKGNQIIVNGVNVHAFLALYRLRPTEKAETFLRGLRTKLDTLLANPAGSLRNEKARASLNKLRQEIDEELDKNRPTTMVGRLLRSGDHPR